MTTTRTTRRIRAGGWFSLALCVALTLAAIATWEDGADPGSLGAGVPAGFAESQTDQSNPGRFRIVADGVVEDAATGIRRRVPGIKLGQMGERALATLDVAGPGVDLRADLRNGKGPRPTRLRIGTLGVNADVVPIGIDQTRALLVPRRADITGWWSGGFIPGEQGPTVIVGHYDSKVAAGVFERLKDTKAGTRITVEQSDGSVFVYRATLIERLNKAEFPTDQVYGATPASTLRLVTCGGKFDTATGHYVDNVIVYADLVKSQVAAVAAVAAVTAVANDDPDKVAPLLGMRTTTTTPTTTTSTSTTATTISTTTKSPTTPVRTPTSGAATPNSGPTTETVPSAAPPTAPTTNGPAVTEPGPTPPVEVTSTTRT